jgi:hypothetical protein
MVFLEENTREPATGIFANTGANKNWIEKATPDLLDRISRV